MSDDVTVGRWVYYHHPHAKVDDPPLAALVVATTGDRKTGGIPGRGQVLRLRCYPETGDIPFVVNMPPFSQGPKAGHWSWPARV